MHIPTCWDKAGQSAGQTLTSLQDICPYSAPTTPPNWDCLYACNWLISRVRPQFHPQLCHFLAMKREEVPFILLRLTFLMHKGRKIVHLPTWPRGHLKVHTRAENPHIWAAHSGPSDRLGAALWGRGLLTLGHPPTAKQSGSAHQKLPGPVCWHYSPGREAGALSMQ